MMSDNQHLYAKAFMPKVKNLVTDDECFIPRLIKFYQTECTAQIATHSTMGTMVDVTQRFIDEGIANIAIQEFAITYLYRFYNDNLNEYGYKLVQSDRDNIYMDMLRIK